MNFTQELGFLFLEISNYTIWYIEIGFACCFYLEIHFI